jgi:hypothetical protein
MKILGVALAVVVKSGLSLANPPRPHHSGEAPWMTPLSEDRSKEFSVREANGGKIIVDNVLGMEWAGKASENLDWYGAYDYCENSTYAGYSDWRLPTYWELISIQLKYAKGQAIYPVFSHLNGKRAIWSMDDSVSIDQPDWDDRWVLFVGSGLVTFELIKERYTAQCIRGDIKPAAGPSGAERFKEVQPDLILDRKTNLLWTGPRDTKVSKDWLFTEVENWYVANLWCEDLVFAGRSDWRLPRLDEAVIIGDLRIPHIFTRMPRIPNTNIGLWTSSAAINRVGPANWHVDFLGQTIVHSKEEKHIFGCVHSN